MQPRGPPPKHGGPGAATGPPPKHGGQHGPSRDRRVKERAGKMASLEEQVTQLTTERDQEILRRTAAEEDLQQEVKKRTAAEEDLQQEVSKRTAAEEDLQQEVSKRQAAEAEVAQEIRKRQALEAEVAQEIRKRKAAEELSEQQKRELDRADNKATKMVLDSLRLQETRLVENHSRAMTELKHQSELQLAEKQGSINTLKDKEDTHFRVRVQLRDEVTALTTKVQQLEADLTRERLARKGGGK